MEKFYVVVEITTGWDYENRATIIRSRDKELCERIARDLTNHIDHQCESRCDYTRSYEVFEEAKLVEVTSWDQWLSIRKDFGDIE